MRRQWAVIATLGAQQALRAFEISAFEARSQFCQGQDRPVLERAPDVTPTDSMPDGYNWDGLPRSILIYVPMPNSAAISVAMFIASAAWSMFLARCLASALCCTASAPKTWAALRVRLLSSSASRPLPRRIRLRRRDPTNRILLGPMLPLILLPGRQLA